MSRINPSMHPEVMTTKTATAGPGRIGTAMLERLAKLDPGGFSPDTARIFLQLGFSRAEQRRVDQLSTSFCPPGILVLWKAAVFAPTWLSTPF